MKSALKFAYDEYRENGFKLLKKNANDKFAYQTKGKQLSEVAHEEFEETAQGYVGIIPESLIIVDNDKYDEENQFEQLLEDLNLNYVPEPFCITPSGGEHYAFKNPYPDLVVGLHGYKAVDIYGGYQSVIPIVGSKAKSKVDGTIKIYEWADDLIEGFVVNEFDERMHEVFKLRERAVGTPDEWDEDGLSLAIKENEMPDDEVDELLTQIPDNVDYDTWLAVGQCLYERFEASEAGLNRWVEFSSSSVEKYDEVFTIKKWNMGHLKPTRTKYTRLRSIVNEFKLSNLKSEISNAGEKKLTKLIKQIAETPHLNTRSNLDASMREDLAKEINTRLKKLKADNPEVKVIQARTIVKSLEHIPTVEELEETGNGSDIDIYTMGKSYGLRIGNKFIPNLTESFVMKHCVNYGVSPVVVKSHLKQCVTITDYKVRSDYNITKDLEFTYEKSKQEHEPDYLVIKNKPINNLLRMLTDETDDEIEHDFFENIWQGKAEDIIKLTALSIRFKADKKNQLMLVTPTSFGKTRMMKHIGFGEVGMETLLGAFQGDGIGSEVLAPIQATGLMLINEVDEAIPKRFKELENEMQVKEFGAAGGTRSVPLHFLVFTSTHDTAILKASDEVAERVMFMQLNYEDSKYNLTESPVFNRDREFYTTIVRNKMVRLFMHYLYEADLVKNDLYKLQDKYRLHPSEDLEGIVEEIRDNTLNEIRKGLLGGGTDNYGRLYVTRKSDVRDYVESLLLDHSGLDLGKYTSIILSKLYTGEVGKTRGSRRYFVNNMVDIIDEFDDLDDF
jgi:hypothetical protein